MRNKEAQIVEFLRAVEVKAEVSPRAPHATRDLRSTRPVLLDRGARALRSLTRCGRAPQARDHELEDTRQRLARTEAALARLMAAE